MNRSDQRAADAPCLRCRGRGTIGLPGLGFLAFGLIAGLPAASAQAQSLRSWTWHADEGPPPIPPGDVGRRSTSWRAAPPDMTNHTVSLAEMRHRANLAGLHLLAAPHRNGHVYIAFGEDTHGLLHRLTFDAYAGTLLQNETSSLKAKAQPVHPASTTPSAAPPQAAPSQANALPSGPDKPAAAPPTVTARELSPIEPQPGVKTAPMLKDSDIDKD